MRTTMLSRAAATLALAFLAVAIAMGAPPAGAAEEQTTCEQGSLARQRTEVDADISVSQFDPALGTLLAVTVNGPSLVLDTDSKFENTASSAVVFSETMTYQVVVTSPGGLPSPAPIGDTITRIPSQTLAAFDGTLDYLGPSAVTQAPTSVTATATAVSATDPATLAAFTGAGTMPFHLASAISETFNGGGGNVDFEINTFLAASVEVCYRYALAGAPPPAAPPGPPAPAAVPPAPVPAQLALTGRATTSLAVAGVALIGVGIAFAHRARVQRARLDA